MIDLHLSDWIIVKIDSDELTSLCDSHKINQLPTLLFFKQGNLVIRNIGADEHQLTQILNLLKSEDGDVVTNSYAAHGLPQSISELDPALRPRVAGQFSVQPEYGDVQQQLLSYLLQTGAGDLSVSARMLLAVSANRVVADALAADPAPTRADTVRLA